MKIAVEFDGTVVSSTDPTKSLPGSVETLQKLVNNKVDLILFTRRPDGQMLLDAVRWFHLNKIPLVGININPSLGYSNSTSSFINSKMWADYYIDNRSIGCPVDTDNNTDWVALELLLISKSILPPVHG